VAAPNKIASATSPIFARGDLHLPLHLAISLHLGIAFLCISTKLKSSDPSWCAQQAVWAQKGVIC